MRDDGGGTRDVAIKVFKSLRAFRHETTVLVLLKDCPYSTHLLDASPEKDSNGKSINNYMVVMDFVPGGDLSMFIIYIFCVV